MLSREWGNGEVDADYDGGTFAAKPPTASAWWFLAVLSVKVLGDFGCTGSRLMFSCSMCSSLCHASVQTVTE